MSPVDLQALRRAIEDAQAGCERDGINYTYIATVEEGDELVVAANRCGLLRLAARLVEYADRPGDHFHLDEASELEKCETPLIVSHVEDPW